MGLNALSGIFRTMRIAGSGMRAERHRMEIISENLANSQSTMTSTGDPYRRKVAIFREVLDRELHGPTAAGVEFAGVWEDDSPFPELLKPGHPDADPKTGMLRMPNVNVIFEMVDLLASTRSYEANLKAATTAKEIAVKTLQLGQR